MAAREQENAKRHAAQFQPKQQRISRFLNRLVAALIAMVIVWFLIGGHISYAVSECSNGVGRCLAGVAVAVGIVDVYDKQGRCIGVGCNF